MTTNEAILSVPDLALADQKATEALAARLAAVARTGDVIALQGDLGAGKTVFARAFVRAFGGTDEEVPSPTFTLVQQYDFDRGTVFHFDLYRLEEAQEAYELGWEDALADGVVLVEWPERLGGLLPADHLAVVLTLGDATDSRRARLSAAGDWGNRLKEVNLDFA
ncbi:MAG: tRNA (adenosine(37)-N6)-threonylcarbamoyltransferase complex ATPase subunit type 1 TsaE [Rhodospirillales bacterium]|nr:tRNA (adenosine(37)-N6)-threonylcarbamoyltransferase complex ATPase subunit type 1 TsaE [Rhodospirillales bacterium]